MITKEELKYCSEVVKGKANKEAYMIAYNGKFSQSGFSSILGRKEIKEKIQELREKEAGKADITKDSVLQKLSKLIVAGMDAINTFGYDYRIATSIGNNIKIVNDMLGFSAELDFRKESKRDNPETMERLQGIIDLMEKACNE